MLDGPSKFGLTGKVALITGAGPGMGRSIAIGFAAAGAEVVICSRSPLRLAGIANEIAELGGSAFPVSCDVSKPEDLIRLHDQAIGRNGRIDVLVNCAFAGPSLADIEAASSASLSREDWRRCFEVNVYAPFSLSHLVAPGMIAHGRGSIVNMISDAADFPDFACGIAYGASKAALAAQTRYLAKELGPQVRVNALCPGLMTPDGSIADYARNLVAALPLERAGHCDEIVGAALFLASDASSYMTGEVLRCDGGRLHARRT